MARFGEVFPEGTKAKNPQFPEGFLRLIAVIFSGEGGIQQDPLRNLLRLNRL
jgi:hypothetical protein